MAKLLRTVSHALYYTKKLNMILHGFSAESRQKKPLIIFDQFNEYINQLENGSLEEINNADRLIQFLLEWCYKITYKKDAANVLIVGNSHTIDIIMKYVPKISRNLGKYYLLDLTKEQAREFFHNVEEDDFEKMYKIIGGRPGHLMKIMDNLNKYGRNVLTESENFLCTTIELFKLAIGESTGIHSLKGKWTKIQFWNVIKLLEEHGVTGASFYDLMKACGNDEIALHDMIRHKWITRKENEEQSTRHMYILPSPLHYYACKEILANKELQSFVFADSEHS